MEVTSSQVIVTANGVASVNVTAADLLTVLTHDDSDRVQASTTITFDTVTSLPNLRISMQSSGDGYGTLAPGYMLVEFAAGSEVNISSDKNIRGLVGILFPCCDWTKLLSQHSLAKAAATVTANKSCMGPKECGDTTRRLFVPLGDAPCNSSGTACLPTAETLQLLWPKWPLAPTCAATAAVEKVQWSQAPVAAELAWSSPSSSFTLESRLQPDHGNTLSFPVSYLSHDHSFQILDRSAREHVWQVSSRDSDRVLQLVKGDRLPLHPSQWSGAMQVKLHGSGLHLTYTVTASLTAGKSQTPLECDVGFLLHLPCSLYVDLDEVREAERWGGPQVTAATSYIDIERPASVSQQHVVWLTVEPSIRQEDPDHEEAVSLRAEMSVPLHLRYQEPSQEAAHSNATLSPPRMAVRCGDLNGFEWIRVSNPPLPVSALMPVGMASHTVPVLIATSLLTLLATLALLLIALYLPPVRGPKRKDE